MKTLRSRRTSSAFSLMRFRREALLRKAGYCLALTDPRRADVAVVVLSESAPLSRVCLAVVMVLASIRPLARKESCSRM